MLTTGKILLNFAAMSVKVLMKELRLKPIAQYARKSLSIFLVELIKLNIALALATI